MFHIMDFLHAANTISFVYSRVITAKMGKLLRKAMYLGEVSIFGTEVLKHTKEGVTF